MAKGINNPKVIKQAAEHQEAKQSLIEQSRSWLEAEQDILAAAPEGSTYYVVTQYDFTEGYFHLDKELQLHANGGKKGWIPIEGEFDLAFNYECRAISDVREIADLKKEVFELRLQAQEQAYFIEQLREGVNDGIEIGVTALSEPEQIQESEIHNLRTLEMSIPEQFEAHKSEISARAIAEMLIAADNSPQVIETVSELVLFAKEYIDQLTASTSDTAKSYALNRYPGKKSEAELEQERKSHKSMFDAMVSTCGKLKDQNQALAATVERLRDFVDSWPLEDAQSDPDFADTVFDIVLETPATNLNAVKPFEYVIKEQGDE